MLTKNIVLNCKKIIFKQGSHMSKNIKEPIDIDPNLIDYIENQILPRYAKMSGHTDKHIRQVIDRSLNFAEEAEEINLDMVYIIAAFHDLGREIDDDHHEIESAKMLLSDRNLKEYFSDTELKTMAEAIEDHRASSKREPRSIYGKIVSSADRNTDVNNMLERCYDSVRFRNQDMPEKELIEKCRKILREKYSTDGYAASKMYFNDPDFIDCLSKIEEITRNPDAFYKIQHDFNKKRGLYNVEISIDT